MKKTRSKMTALMLCALAACLGCNYNSFDKPNANVALANAEGQKSAFESDLQSLKTADLKYIFVVRRTDGAAFDGEDKRYLRTNLPTTNRVIMTDEGKAFIIGSNYKFPPENIEVLRLRFNIEDYSTVD